MSNEMVLIDPTVLEDEAKQIEAVSETIGDLLNARQAAIEALNWQGASREAFAAMFGETRVQLRDVEAQITGIATLLRNAKDGMLTADESIASAMNR